MNQAPYPQRGDAPRKGMAIASLVLGILSILTLGCLGVGALTGLILGIVALVRSNKAPSVFGGRGLAIGGIVTSGISVILVPFVGIFAAIAIPSLLRARLSANESATIGDIRTVISAQTAYSAANGGHYEGRMPCLLVPSQGCIPGYSPNAATFLDSALVSLDAKNGYTRKLVQGPPPDGLDPQVSSPSSVASFAYLAVPVKQGNTGIRGFCGDASGTICSTPDGSEPTVVAGTCDLSTCEMLR